MAEVCGGALLLHNQECHQPFSHYSTVTVDVCGPDDTENPVSTLGLCPQLKVKTSKPGEAMQKPLTDSSLIFLTVL